MGKERYDRIIIGAGLYGLYSAVYCGRKGEKVLVLERDSAPFSRATYINQARVHMGYHYPRSLSTATRSREYFDRFCADFPRSIKTDFTQIYAMGRNFSWTDREAFKKFCRDADIPCRPVSTREYFKDGLCDGAFVTKEYTYDRGILRDILMKEISSLPGVRLLCDNKVTGIDRDTSEYSVSVRSGGSYSAPFVLNATYAAVNGINRLAGFEPFPIKYELCEIILCRAGKNLRNVGITVMDGPFFSIMPFGKTGYHSLTSVTFTPHVTCYGSLPEFGCQEGIESFCTPGSLGNCDNCPHRRKSAWEYMQKLAGKYLRDEYEFKYCKSLFSMKPILKLSEIDDSRPTMVRIMSKDPTFVSVLSGKINTVYDLEEVLDGEY